jgi:protein-S-isoprenylcysteine O-methyltransferase Ste14
VTVLVAKLIWVLGCVAWFIIRYPHQRRSRKTPVAQRTAPMLERVLLATSFCGLFVVPLIFVLTDQPSFANYPFRPLLGFAGVVVFGGALALFYRIHRELGRSWSVTLEIRDRHVLVTEGLYRYLRHPMYSAFWLWALAQLLLLPNWIAGPAGLIGFGILFFGRVGAEERMMLATFGEEYQAYMQRTKRIIPGIY